MRIEPPMSVPNPRGAAGVSRLLDWRKQVDGMGRERNVERKRTPPNPNQRPLTSRTPSRTQLSILRIHSPPNNIVHRLARHERMRDTRLTEQHRPTIPQLPHHLTLKHFFFARPLLSLKRANPSHVAHCRLDIFDVELVFERDGQAV
jgi:hypothetical protein